MRTLRLYILREHLTPFFVTLCGLTTALLIGNVIKLAELVIAKGVSVLDILRLLIYLIPHMLSFTIPMAGLIAMILAFGRLSSDYELIAMRASGVAPMRLVIPILTVAMLISGGILVMNDRLIPESHLAFRRQLKAIGIKRPAAYLEAGAFIKEFPPYVIFVYHVQDNRLFHVRIYEPQAQGPTRTILAERGLFEPLPHERGVKLTLRDGTIDEWDPEHPGSLYKVLFGSYTMELAADEAAGRVGKKLKEMTLRELVRERQRLDAQDIETLPISLELHGNIAMSFATVVFTIFGLALGLRSHHHERLLVFVWVLGLFIAYYVASIGTNTLAIKGWLPAWLAMWLPNLLGGVFGTVHVWRALRS